MRWYTLRTFSIADARTMDGSMDGWIDRMHHNNGKHLIEHLEGALVKGSAET